MVPALEELDVYKGGRPVQVTVPPFGNGCDRQEQKAAGAYEEGCLGRVREEIGTFDSESPSPTEWSHWWKGRRAQGQPGQVSNIGKDVGNKT